MDTDKHRAFMRTIQSLIPLVGLAFGLPSAVSARLSDAATTPTSNGKGAEPLMLDVAQFCKEPLVGGDKTNGSIQFTVGRQLIDGLPFMIQGVGCVYGKKEAAWQRFQESSCPDFLGIRIGRRFDELHLVHAAKWADVEGQTIALIRLNYDDETQYEFPIRYGGHVRDWQRLRSEEKELLTDPKTKIIWRGPEIENYRSTQRMFKSVLVNPHPEKAVSTMDVLSTKYLSSYELVAATVADRDPSRPVTPPSAADEPERHFDGKVTVRVMDEATRQPIAGALVEMWTRPV